MTETPSKDTGRAAGTLALARLLDGMSALDGGRPGVARYRFQQVIHESKMDPTLEVGHAWRALAEAALLEGDAATAESHLKQAVNIFRETARLKPASRIRAQEGEGMVLLLGGELLLRRGMASSGDALFGRARVLFARLGDDRSAEAWAATGRLSLLAGDGEAAMAAYKRALTGYEEVGNVAGHAEVLLDLAQLERANDPSAVLRLLDLAQSMARNAGRSELLARILIARAEVCEDAQAAEDAGLEALQRAVDAGSRALAGLALVSLGVRGWDGGERPLLAGAQALLDAEHYPGLGLALLRIAQAGLKVGDPELVLAACEGAWRVFRSTDPQEGLVRLLRVAERAFVLMRAPRPVLIASFARAALSGRRDPHALQVRDYYASRAPAGLVARLASSSRDTLLGEARRAIQQAIVPALRRFGLLASSFATAQGALDVLGVLAGVSPRAAARQLILIAPAVLPAALPDPELPTDIETGFAVGTIARMSVPVSPASGPVSTPARSTRSPIYDPDGRLAAMVGSSLHVAAEGAPVAAAAAEAAGDEVEDFPEDAGITDWSRQAPGSAPRPPAPDPSHSPGWAELARTGFGGPASQETHLSDVPHSPYAPPTRLSPLGRTRDEDDTEEVTARNRMSTSYGAFDTLTDPAVDRVPPGGTWRPVEEGAVEEDENPTMFMLRPPTATRGQDGPKKRPEASRVIDEALGGWGLEDDSPTPGRD